MLYFIGHVGYDILGTLQFAYEVMKTLHKEERDKVYINNMQEGKWIEYCR